MGQEALDVHNAMQEEGISAPDSVTFVCLLQACATVGTTAVEKGKQVRAQIEEQGLETDGQLSEHVCKVWQPGDAQSLGMLRLPEKTLVMWTAMIIGYSQQGMGQEALHLYSAMQDEGITAPDSVTFECLLQSCASIGTASMEKRKQLHVQIGELGLGADVVVGCSLVNLYAKCGSLEDAQSVFDSLPEKNVNTPAPGVRRIVQKGPCCLESSSEHSMKLLSLNRAESYSMVRKMWKEAELRELVGGVRGDGGVSILIAWEDDGRHLCSASSVR